MVQSSGRVEKPRRRKRIRFGYDPFHTDKMFVYSGIKTHLMLTEAKTCMHCGKELKAEMRKDAKFCKPECRTAYNNAQRYGLEPHVMRVDKVLHRNYGILKDVLKTKERTSITREKLIRLGFKFKFCTQAKGEYRYCYQLCYKKMEDGSYLIVKGFDSYVNPDTDSE